MSTKRRACDHCGSTMFLNGRTWLKDKGNNKRFRVDLGCALMLSERGVIELKGQNYQLNYN